MKPAQIVAIIVLTLGTGFAVDRVLAPALERREAAETTAANVQTTPQQTRRVSVASDISGEPIANAAILRKENDGHYWATANVDGTSVRFMVDTGASTVALTHHDAQRIGLMPDTLDYSWSIRTAGGEVKGASVLIPSIRIGQVSVENVEAMVLRDGLSQSLLGMTFLGELHSYEFRQQNLILRQ